MSLEELQTLCGDAIDWRRCAPPLAPRRPRATINCHLAYAFGASWREDERRFCTAQHAPLAPAHGRVRRPPPAAGTLC